MNLIGVVSVVSPVYIFFSCSDESCSSVQTIDRLRHITVSYSMLLLCIAYLYYAMCLISILEEVCLPPLPLFFCIAQLVVDLWCQNSARFNSDMSALSLSLLAIPSFIILASRCVYNFLSAYGVYTIMIDNVTGGGVRHFSCVLPFL